MPFPTELLRRMLFLPVKEAEERERQVVLTQCALHNARTENGLARALMQNKVKDLRSLLNETLERLG